MQVDGLVLGKQKITALSPNQASASPTGEDTPGEKKAQDLPSGIILS
jgi:hypothetical protein